MDECVKGRKLGWRTLRKAWQLHARQFGRVGIRACSEHGAKGGPFVLVVEMDAVHGNTQHARAGCFDVLDHDVL